MDGNVCKLPPASKPQTSDVSQAPVEVICVSASFASRMLKCNVHVACSPAQASPHACWEQEQRHLWGIGGVGRGILRNRRPLAMQRQ